MATPESWGNTFARFCLLSGNHGSVFQHWGSKNQNTVAISATEAEFMALAKTTQECIYMRGILKSLMLEQEEPTVIFEDNQGAIKLSKNPIINQRTKHIDVRYYFVREKIGKEIEIKYKETAEMVADCLTKPLGRVKVAKFAKYMLGA